MSDEHCTCAYCTRRAGAPAPHLDDTTEVPAWIVWQRDDGGGRPYIRAIDTSEARALKHVQYLKGEARLMNQPPVDFLIEETRLNHLYGNNMLKAIAQKRDKGY